jgi:type IX secretion system PorP/SprF family membrane protein
MGIRIIIVMLLSILLNVVAQAQQDPVYSQYMFSMMSINPAYAGSRDVLSVTGIYRKQWVNVKGSPTTQFLSGDFALKNKKVGLGAQLFNDESGIIQNTGFYGSYAYRIRFNKAVLSMGIQAGVTRFKANYSALQLGDDQLDPAFADNQNEFRPNFGAGVYFNTERFYAGISVPHLVGAGKVETDAKGGSIREQANHWFFTTGVVLPLSPYLNLKPSVLLRVVDGAPLHADINANLWMHDVVAIGVSYRTSESLVGMLEFQATPQFRFGYAYDYMFSSLKGFGSHEFMLRYEFGYNKKNMVSPRYF